METASWSWSTGFVQSAKSAALSFWRFPVPLKFSTLLDLRVGDDLGFVIEICLQSQEDTMDLTGGWTAAAAAT